MMKIIKLSIIFSMFLSSAFISPVLPADPLSTPTPVACGSFLRLTDIDTLEVVNPRGSSKYGLVYQFQDTGGTISSYGHIFDTENKFYNKQVGEGNIRLRSFVHKGFNIQTGDNLLVTYDGDQQKRIYLPALTGYTELYVGGNGATYYDEWLCQIAQEASIPTPSPTISPIPTLTPEGFRTATPTPVCLCCPTPTPTPMPPYCSSCPQVISGSITLSDQTSTQDVIYDFTYNCLRQTNILHDWWTSSTDWLDVYPGQGFGFDSQTFVISIALGDTSSLSPGPHTDWIRFDHDWGCEESYLRVDYYIPTPTPTPPPEFFCLTDVEGLKVTHPRGDESYNLVYQLRDEAGEIISWGHIFDNENRYYDKSARDGKVLLRSFAHKGFNTQTGDNLLLTYDGGQQKRIYLPVLEGYKELYVDTNGSTYYDEWLLQIAQAALPPSPTPTLTPEGYFTTPTTTPCCYMSVTPTAAPTPSPPDCYGCPRVLTGSITLSNQTSSREVVYDFTYNCVRQTNLIHNWWTATTDWLEVNPPQGFGFDSQLFEVTILLGNTSSLSPGEHTAWVTFSNDWICNPTTLTVTYYKPTPSPTPSIYPTPTPSPSPSLAPTPMIMILGSGDYNGDGTSDIAIFRETVGLWALRGISRLYFGIIGDIPVSGDYNGDGTTDVGIYRGNSGLWAIRDISRLYFGSSSYIPIPGDYDGDGFCDIGLFRGENGLWAIRDLTRVYFGGSGDIPIPGDYDGDISADIAIFRRSSGLWAMRYLSRIYFGTGGDQPVPGDYDGGGTSSPAIFRSSSGLWAVRGLTRTYFGGGSDRPVPGDFEGDGVDCPGIFRASTGLWAVRGVSRVYFGTTGDIPVTR